MGKNLGGGNSEDSSLRSQVRVSNFEENDCIWSSVNPCSGASFWDEGISLKIRLEKFSRKPSVHFLEIFV